MTGRLYETLYMPRSEKRTPYIRRWPSMLCAALDYSKQQGHRATTTMLRRGWPLPPGVVLVAECACTNTCLSVCESTQPDLVPFGESPSGVVSGWPLRRNYLLATSSHTDGDYHLATVLAILVTQTELNAGSGWARQGRL